MPKRNGENAENDKNHRKGIADSQGEGQDYEGQEEEKLHDIEGGEGEEIVPAIEKSLLYEKTDHIVSILHA